MAKAETKRLLIIPFRDTDRVAIGADLNILLLKARMRVNSNHPQEADGVPQIARHFRLQSL